MTKNIDTFYSYLQTHKTDNVHKYITYVGATDKLPDKICSSKVLYDILRDDLDTYFKQVVFRETFMEYFKWKVLYSKNPESQFLDAYYY